MAPNSMETTGFELDTGGIDTLLDDCGRGAEDVIAVLQGIQARYNYLPEPVLRYVCEQSAITPASIVGVSTFYRQFRHTPAGRHLVSVCVGTACHVKGASGIIDALRRYLKLADGEDTDAERRFTVQSVNCLGCCTLAPVVKVDDVLYGYATTDTVGELLEDFLSRETAGGDGPASAELAPGDVAAEIRVGMGSCCVASGAMGVEQALRARVAAWRIPVSVLRVGCMGLSYDEPVVEIDVPGRPPRLYVQVRSEDAARLLHENFPAPRLWDRLRHAAGRWLEWCFAGEGESRLRRFRTDARDPQIAPYLDPQVHIATEGWGRLDPLSLGDYERAGGFSGFRRVLRRGDPEAVIAAIAESGLRGRGGAGFPTHSKWDAVRRAAGRGKVVICNGDEGDPGAFMDRMLLESYPYRIIEGMLIAGYAVGAHEGIFYIRVEYPLAIQRVEAALAHCGGAGLLGDRVLGSDFSFSIRIKPGAGAFVCGEETALIAAVEGRRGTPRLRPPYPAERGLHGRPTLVNNTETLALVPWILRNGPEAFAAIGTPTSMGTKVFALAGKVKRGGLVEVPMGMTIRRVVEEIGGGVPQHHRLKAVQIGGPSGGCIPARLADTPIDYEALTAVGAMMGSGGLVVLDETDCMVEVARYFLAFTQEESCGKCTFCRLGTHRMHEILERLCGGTGRSSDLVELERLAGLVRHGSLCGLGRSAPNPVLTTLRYFRDEYLAHVNGMCPAGQCPALITYVVTDDCMGCTRCARQCPTGAIPATPYEQHVIDAALCVKCDGCRRTCPVGAVVVKSRGEVVRHGDIYA